jgi:hypothetical protein
MGTLIGDRLVEIITAQLNETVTWGEEDEEVEEEVAHPAGELKR